MQGRIVRRALGSLMGLLLLTGVVGGASAAPLACDTTAVSGQVTKAGAPLTVRSTDGRERAVSAGPGLVIIRNGANAAFGDVREGDQVNVTVPAGAADCTATRIEAASTAVAPEPDRTGLWGLLGLLGLGGLAGLLRRPQRPVHNTERTERVVVEPSSTVDTIETRPTRR